MKLTYSPAQPSDAELLFTLNKALIDTYEDLCTIDYPKVLGWVRRNLEQNIPHFRRVLLDGETVGFYCLTEEDGKTELDSLFVLPPWQGKGIGTAILQKCQNDAAPLFLYVFKRNVRAIALYKRLGFQITKEVGKTRYIMEFK